MEPVLIDTHCHLDMDAFDSDRDDVINRALDANIKYLINVASDRKSITKGLELSGTFPNIYSTVGIHPHDAKILDDKLLKEIRKWTREPKVVAIGEIGLDYHYLNSPQGVQIEAFRKQIALAKKTKLPIIVHSREAKNDTLRILNEEGDGVIGVFHCFSGDEDMARKAMELGFYISIAGPVTFKNAQELRKVAKIVPDEFLLIETDSPYLGPVPKRGKRNEPAFLRHTAWAVADIRGVSIQDLARITTLNAMKLFKIEDIADKGEIAYQIRDSLYLNVTSKCTNKCGFCVRFRTKNVKGHNLRLSREPSALQLIKAIKDPKKYKEVVFCGLGEPTIRMDLIKKVGKWIKKEGGKVRLNTNGHGSVFNGRNIVPELKGIVDSISVSLDAENEEIYNKVCKPSVKDAFNSMIEFIKDSKAVIPEVKVTVVKIPEIDIKKCKALADELGVEMRIREFNVVG